MGGREGFIGNQIGATGRQNFMRVFMCYQKAQEDWKGRSWRESLDGGGGMVVVGCM